MQMICLHNSWPKTENSTRYRLFAELCIELVSQDSWESYKTHTLSTIGKISELIEYCQLVQSRTVPKPTLIPIVEEVNYSIVKDPIVVALLYKKNVGGISFEISSKETIEAITSQAGTIFDLLISEYKKECEDGIKSICATQGSKNSLISHVKHYISFLVSSGYSRKYVLDVCNSLFCNDDVKRCDIKLLNKFFSKFPLFEGEKKFTVLICGRNPSVRYLNNLLNLTKIKNYSDLSTRIKNVIPERFGEGEKKSIGLLENVSAFDPYSAARFAKTIIAVARSIEFLHPNNFKLKIDNEAYVIEDNNNATKVYFNNLFEPTGHLKTHSERRKDSRALVRYIFGGGPENEKKLKKLFNSIQSMNLASIAPEPQAKLVSIWAAFEALLPEPTKEEKSVRINHFASKILPCTVYDYISDQFLQCYKNSVKITNSGFKDFVDTEGVGSCSEEKFASLFLASELTQKKLLEFVSEHPLMLNRYYRLQRYLTRRTETVRSIEIHETRVLWQIHRIYRERNRIVHNAEISSHLDSLVENAYGYYRNVIISLEKVSANYGISEPEHALTLVEKLYDAKKERLLEASNKSISEKEFLEQIFSDRLFSSES